MYNNQTTFDDPTPLIQFARIYNNDEKQFVQVRSILKDMLRYNMIVAAKYVMVA